MRKMITRFFMLTVVLLNAYGADDFWDALSRNALDEAKGIALERAGEEEVYFLYLSNLYNLTGDPDRFTIYQFNYYKNPGNDDDLAEIAARVSEDYRESYVYSFLGILLWENNLKTASMKYLRESVEMDSMNPYGNNYFSMVFYQNDKPDKYLEYALKALEGKKDYSEAYNNAAVAYQELGRDEEAVQMLRECIVSCEKPHINTYFNLLNAVGTDGIGIKNRGGEYTIEGDSALSDENILFIHDLLQGSVYKYEQMIQVLIDRADYGEAMALIEMAEENGVGAAGDFYLAQVWSQLGNAVKVRNYTAGLLEDDLSYDKFYSAGNLLYGSGDLEKAIPLYERALAVLDEEDTLYGMRINANLGTCHLRLGDEAKGMAFMEKGLEYNEYDVISLANIGYFYKLGGEAEKARGYLEKALLYTDDDSLKGQLNELLENL